MREIERFPNLGHNLFENDKGRTIGKVMGGGGEGNFKAAGIFFRYQIPCMSFFGAIE